MKVLVADKFEQSGLDGLKGLGLEIVFDPALKEEALEAKIKETGAEILVVRSTKVTEPMLKGGKLGLVIRAGAGYNTIDVDAATQNNVSVANCPGKNSIAVAELAFGHILAMDRKIPDNVAELRQGNWKKGAFSKAKGVYGTTLGLVGLGNIAQELIPRAKAFGMKVVAYSRWITPDIAAALGIGRCATLEEVAAMSDFVSIHVSLNPATKGMIGKAFFDKMKQGATLINTSRAEVVDSAAMLEALNAGKISAGLDVFDNEPAGSEGTYEGPLKDHPRVYCTHHIGASTEQAQEAVAAETVRIAKHFQADGTVLNKVGGPKGGKSTNLLVVRYCCAEALEGVIAELKKAGVNVNEREYIDLCCRGAIAELAVDKAPSDATVLSVKLQQGVFDVTVLPL
jgi:D-3-phosphoglycerate dehydrogenase / 2-oxoglutarate reductase